MSDSLLQEVSVSSLAFPYDQNTPSTIFQSRVVAGIAGDVASEFLPPERDSRFGLVAVSAALMSVPEAPMNKDDLTPPVHDDVRTPRKRSVMETVAHTHGAEQAPDAKLRRRILASDRRHVRAAALRTNAVGHSVSPPLLIGSFGAR